MLIGSAVGGCISLYTEFMTKDEAVKTYPERSFRLADPVTPLKMDNHRARFGTSVWTDDTDQALCILLGYLHIGKTDAKDFASRLHVWVLQGLSALQTSSLGLGATVTAAVETPDFLKDPNAARNRAWEEGNFYGVANGSLMRCHPLGAICVFKSLKDL
jgi:ADP-ribosylglycohydrolase